MHYSMLNENALPLKYLGILLLIHKVNIFSLIFY